MTDRIAQRIAVVTGAGSGIGRAVALGLHRRGARLALADWDAAGLDEIRGLLEDDDVFTMRVDVSKQDQVAAFAAAVQDRFGGADQLYNIAGLGGGGRSIAEHSYEQFERIFGVNVWGVIYGTKEFLPQLSRSSAAHIVNISSLNGIMGQPGIGAYCTSKFAVRGFTETLRAELLQQGSSIGVTLVHPGGVRTAIRAAKPVELGGEPGAIEAEASMSDAERRRNEIYERKLFKMSAEDAAEQILRGVQRRRGRVLLGQAKWVDRLVRLAPERYPRIVASWSKRTFE